METSYMFLSHGLVMQGFHYVSCFFILLLSLDHGSHLIYVSGNDCSKQRCGNVNVSYPFTLHGSNCPSFGTDGNFTLNCTSDVLRREGHHLAPVLSILPDSLILEFTDLTSKYPVIDGHCNLNASSSALYEINFDYGGPYISANDNQFGSFGCSFGSFIFYYQSDDGLAYEEAGCEPLCGFDIDKASKFPIVNQSSGCGAHVNCCISNFPANARTTYYEIEPSSDDPSPCSSYAVPFHPDYTDFEHKSFGLRVLWALPDLDVYAQLKPLKSPSGTIDFADLPGYISTVCSNFSQIIIVDEVPGYRCSCLRGYAGDGYARGRGCKDINECNDATITNLCLAGKAECRNVEGSYSCHCKSRWHAGDGRRNGTGCPISPTLIKAVAITGGVSGLMLLLLSLIGTIILIDRRRKQRYFKQNGGLELQAYIAAGTGRESTRFFTAEELREATQSFSEHLKLGGGGFGTVYRGRLRDGRFVAVKKANQPTGDADRNQFLNELAILTHINHRHIVRLYGCCLETAHPLLVYEFVRNGDLADNLASVMAMGWAKRLQVATQVADALAYLHTAASPPILHRDVKTANILLDDNLDAKVADFGISRLIPEGEKCVSTVVQGTLGYLDPEYFQTLHLTDKSDVYSLGVVLVELITGLKPVDNHTRDIKFANLAMLFMERMLEERLPELMDARLLHHEDEVEYQQAQWMRLQLYTSIHDVANLARPCLALRGEERPSMSELALKLHQITSAFQRPAQYEDELEELRPLMIFEDVP